MTDPIREVTTNDHIDEEALPELLEEKRTRERLSLQIAFEEGL